MTKRRSSALELAVLGLLNEQPLHGYELRKQVSTLRGWWPVLSYGSLYPCLKRMLRDGLITHDTTATPPAPGGQARPGRRGKIIYQLTGDGKDRFAELMSAVGPSTWEDDGFGVRFAFFSSATAETRLRVLEGRRTRMEERLDTVRTNLARSRERVDRYTLELHRHGLESVEREVRWLTDLIESERSARPQHTRPPGDDQPDAGSSGTPREDRISGSDKE